MITNFSHFKKSISTLIASFALSFTVMGQNTQLNWGTFVTTPLTGGSGSTYQRDLASDAAGNVFGGGQTEMNISPKGKIRGFVDTTNNGGTQDGYLYKLASDGKSLLWWTYVGGAGLDDIWGVEYSKEGANEYVYVVGYSNNALTMNGGIAPISAKKTGNDAFLAKYNATNGAIVWHTHLGTTNDDYGLSIKVSSTKVHITGYAGNSLPTTPNSFKTTTNNQDGFYARYDLSGNLNYCSYLGYDAYYSIGAITGLQGGRGLEVIGDDDVLIAGTAISDGLFTSFTTNEITTGSVPSRTWNATYNTYNPVGYIMRIKPLSSGSSDVLFASRIKTTNANDFTVANDVRWSSYLGKNYIYVLGFTNGVIAGIPSGSFQTTNKGRVDSYLMRIDPNTYSIDAATMYGGDSDDWGVSLNVCTGEPTFSGETGDPNLTDKASKDLPVVLPITSGGASPKVMDKPQGLTDMFVTSIAGDFKSVTFSSYLGGSNREEPFVSHSLRGKTGGHTIANNSLIVGASSHSGIDMPTTAGVYITAQNFTGGPDVDFIVSIPKPGGVCRVEIETGNSAPQLDLDSVKTGVNNGQTYTEKDIIGVQIATKSKITDTDDANISGATIILTNKQLGDNLIFKGTVPTGINTPIVTSNSGAIYIKLEGSATKAAYQNAINSIYYLNDSTGNKNPSNTNRFINVKVFDGKDSSNLAVDTIKFNLVNDAPDLDLDFSFRGKGDKDTLFENGLAVAIGKLGKVLITDADDSNIDSARVILTNAYLGDNLNIGSFAGLGGIIGSKNNPTLVQNTPGTITVKLVTSTTKANYQNAINQITFSNSIDSLNNTPRIVSVQVWDGQLWSNIAYDTINITRIADCPDVDLNTDSTGNNNKVTYAENNTSGVQIVNNNISITDKDTYNQTWTVTVTLSNRQAGDSLIRTATSVGGFNIGAPNLSNSAQISISITGTGTSDQLENALKTIRFKNSSDAPLTSPVRNINIDFNSADNDVTCPILRAVSLVTVTASNDAPFLDLDANNSSGKTGSDNDTTFTENDSNIGAKIGDIDLFTSDVDDTNLDSAIVKLTNRQFGDTIRVNGTLPGGLTFTTNKVGSVTTLKIIGITTIANYNTALKQLEFYNSANGPSTIDRNITVVVHDGNTYSNTAISTIKFKAVNDDPILDLDVSKSGSGFDTTYVENNTSGVNISKQGTDRTLITDFDDSNIESAKIKLTNTFPGDTIILTGNGTGFTITTTKESGNTVINISGPGTKSQYQTLIQSIKFSNKSNSPDTTTRILNTYVSDGDSLSNNAITKIKFTATNDCPTITINGASTTNTVTFTENGSPAKITNGVTISDADKLTQNWSATIELATAVALDNIIVPKSKNNFTVSGPTTAAGKITVTISGNGTAANLASLIDSLYFTSSSESPVTTARIVTIMIKDEANCESNVGTTTINLTATNDCPTITINGASTSNTVTFIENRSPSKITNGITISDADKSTQDWSASIELETAVALDNIIVPRSKNSFTVTGPTSTTGKITVTINGIGTASNLSALIDSLYFTTSSNAPVTTPRIVTIKIKDEANCESNAGTTTINITTTNDCPEIDLNGATSGNDYSTIYVEKSVGIEVASSNLTISDIDAGTNDQNWSATILLTNRVSPEDSLFGPANANGFNVSATDYSVTGNASIKITGTGTAANLATLLKGVTYKAGSINPSSTVRNLTITIADDSCSKSANTNISISTINDPFIVKKDSVITATNTAITNRSLTTIQQNNIDPEDDVLIVTKVNKDPKNGTLTVDLGNQTYTYNPNNLYYGRDTIYFEVCDRKTGGNCKQDTLYVIIKKVIEGLKLDLDSTRRGTGYYTTFTEGFDIKGVSTGVSAVDITSKNVGLLNYDLEKVNSASVILNNKQKGDTLFVKNGTLPCGLTYTTQTSSSAITITINGAADTTCYKNALESIQFDNRTYDLSNTDRYINISVSNINGSSNLTTDTIKVNVVNQEPVVFDKEIIINEDSVVTSSLTFLLNNDYDPDGDSITIQTIQNHPLNGKFSIDKTKKTFTYIPDQDYVGSDSVIISICDTKNACLNQKLKIIILPVNDAPYIDLDPNSKIGKDSADYDKAKFNEKGIGVKIHNGVKVTDVDNTTLMSATITLTNKKQLDTLLIGTLPNTLKATLTSTTDKIVITITTKDNNPGTLANYQSAINAIQFKNTSNNPDSTTRIVTVVVNDSTLSSNIATAFIKIESSNDAPDVVDDSLVTKEDTKITVSVKDIIKNDKDPEGDTLTVKETVIVTKHGTFTVTKDSVSYNPNKDYYGFDTVVVSVCDKQNVCPNKNIYIRVIPINDNPFLDLDKDNSSGSLIADFDTAYTENGSGIKISDTDIVITDNDDKTGYTDDITTAIITLTNTKKGDVLVSTGTLPNGVTVTTTIVDNATIITINGSSSKSNYQSIINNIQYSNTEDSLNTEDRKITVVISDGDSLSNVATTTIRLINTNDSVITKTNTITTKEDSVICVSLTEITKNDKDPEGDAISVTEATISTSNGTVVIANGTLCYNPKKDFNGKDSVIISVCDPQGKCSNKKVIITVLPVNDAPYIDLEISTKLGKDSADYKSEFTEQLGAIGISNVALISDIDNSKLLSATIVLTNKKAADTLLVGKLPNTLKATITSNKDSILIVLTAKGNVGGSLQDYQDAINNIQFNNTSKNLDKTIRLVKVFAKDSALASNIATDTITMKLVNDCPVTKNDTASIYEDITLTRSFASLLKNDMDYENDVLSILKNEIALQGKNGVLTKFTDSTYSYYPNSNFNGKDTVAFYVTDGDNKCKIINYLYINVIPVNDDPIVKNEYVTILKNNTTTINYGSNDNDDADKTALKYEKIDDQMVGASATVNKTNKTISYIPLHNFIGVDTIIFEVCDNGFPLPAICKNDTVFIRIIEPVNTCPKFSLDADSSNGKYIDGVDNGVTFIENASPIALADVDAYIKDTEDDLMASVKVELNKSYPGDSLFVQGASSLNNIKTEVTKDSLNRWTVTFTGRLADGLADTSDFRKAIQAVRYVNKRDDINSELRAVIFTLNDGKGNSCNRSAVSYINVVPVNDIQIVKNDTLTVYEDVLAIRKIKQLLLNDFDIDGTPLYVNGFALNKNKKDSLSGYNGKLTFISDTTFSYLSKENYNSLLNGDDQVVVKVCDSPTSPTYCLNDTIFIKIIPVPDTPIVNNETYTYVKVKNKAEETEFVSYFSTLKNDEDLDGGKLVVKADTITGKNGKIIFTQEGTFVYNSTKGLGKDKFVVSVCNETSNLCKNDTVTIIITGVPDGFSPNEDNTNDKFEIESDPTWGKIGLDVYNRWGDIVYKSNDYQNDWNGTSNKGLTIGNELPDGTYFINVTYSNNNEENVVKYITILR